MILSASQVKTVRNCVDQSGIVNETLKDDVLDHLCCAIEFKLENGLKFNEALEQARFELAPDGLEEIQQETTFVLNPLKIIHMKKFMYVIGLITSIGMTMGLTFKILHMPSAEELFNFGFFGFAFIFLPLLAIDRFKRKINQALYEKLRLISGFITTVVVGFSVLFKIFHYEGANLLLLTGISTFCFLFLPTLFFSMYKKSIS